MDTIFALASAQGKAGVAVVRVSGKNVHRALSALTGLIDLPLRPTVRSIRDRNGILIDRGLILGFPEGRSFTGESTIEFQLHGSPAIVRSVLNELSQIDGCRLAEAGEFTRRALDNGQLDLAQVEGLADLLDAETESQRRQAIAVFEGSLGKLATEWRRKLIRAGALVQATIDFADEEVPEDVSPEVLDLIRSVKNELDTQLDGYDAAEKVRDGFRVAIVGKPNVGKSSLLNYLAGREVAITSDIAGTTRDLVEIHMDISGLSVSFTDTAGLRTTDDPLETLGIERALTYASSADLRIFLADDQGFEDSVAIKDGDIHVETKADLKLDRNSDVLNISTITGAGISELKNQIFQVLSARAQQAGSLTRDRHRMAVEKAVDLLTEVLARLPKGSAEPDLVAEDLRQASQYLGAIVGAIGVEDILDEVFSSFCLGK